MYLTSPSALFLAVASLMPLRARIAAMPSPQHSEHAASAQAQVQQLIASGADAAPATIAPLWSALPSITVAEAQGTYKGGLFNATAQQSSPIHWWGKQIVSEVAVNPLLSNAPNDSSIVFPYPRENIAQARDVEHEGVVSATIIYNRLPLLDYLRVVKDEDDELILLGKSDLLGKAADPPYFWLKRQEGVKVDFQFKNPYPNSSGF